MPRLRKRYVLLGILAVLLTAAVLLFPAWKSGSDHGGQKFAEPFRIAGNLYYVGANDISSFLITSPQGHILIDGGYPGTPPLIMQSIAKLGFDIRDVKILLNTEPHFDHAGGLAELQRASGAELRASDFSAIALEAGGDEGPNTGFLPYRMLIWLHFIKYDAPRVHHRFRDGATVSLGENTLTAHITGGHTRGCTTWTFPVRDGDRVLNAVLACSLTLLPGMRFVPPERYTGIRADFERTFGVLRSLPEDIWMTVHAREWGRYRKYVASTTMKRPADAFIDRPGYQEYIAKGEARFRKELAEQMRP